MRIPIIISFAILSLAISPLTSAPAYAAKLCQGDHLHYGSSGSFKRKRDAMRDAIQSWAGFTIFEYGKEWGHWRHSVNKTVNCKKDSYKLWSCSIQSTPCALVKRKRRRK